MRKDDLIRLRHMLEAARERILPVIKQKKIRMLILPSKIH